MCVSHTKGTNKLESLFLASIIWHASYLKAICLPLVFSLSVVTLLLGNVRLRFTFKLWTVKPIIQINLILTFNVRSHYHLDASWAWQNNNKAYNTKDTKSAKNHLEKLTTSESFWMAIALYPYPVSMNNKIPINIFQFNLKSHMIVNRFILTLNHIHS